MREFFVCYLVLIFYFIVWFGLVWFGFGLFWFFYFFSMELCLNSHGQTTT